MNNYEYTGEIKKINMYEDSEHPVTLKAVKLTEEGLRKAYESKTNKEKFGYTLEQLKERNIAWIEKDENIRRDALLLAGSEISGDSFADGEAFVYDSVLSDKASATGKCFVIGCRLQSEAKVSDEASIANTTMSGFSSVSGKASLLYSTLSDNVKVSEEAKVFFTDAFGNAIIKGSACLGISRDGKKSNMLSKVASGSNGFFVLKDSQGDRITISDFAEVKDNAEILDRAKISGHAIICDNAKMKDDAILSHYAIAKGNAELKGKIRFEGSQTISKGSIEKYSDLLKDNNYNQKTEINYMEIGETFINTDVPDFLAYVRTSYKWLKAAIKNNLFEQNFKIKDNIVMKVYWASSEQPNGNWWDYLGSPETYAEKMKCNLEFYDITDPKHPCLIEDKSLEGQILAELPKLVEERGSFVFNGKERNIISKGGYYIRKRNGIEESFYGVETPGHRLWNAFKKEFATKVDEIRKNYDHIKKNDYKKGAQIINQPVRMKELFRSKSSILTRGNNILTTINNANIIKEKSFYGLDIQGNEKRLQDKLNEIVRESDYVLDLYNPNKIKYQSRPYEDAFQVCLNQRNEGAQALTTSSIQGNTSAGIKYCQTNGMFNVFDEPAEIIVKAYKVKDKIVDNSQIYELSNNEAHQSIIYDFRESCFDNQAKKIIPDADYAFDKDDIRLCEMNKVNYVFANNYTGQSAITSVIPLNDGPPSREILAASQDKANTPAIKTSDLSALYKCLDYFLETNDSILEKIGINICTPEDIVENEKPSNIVTEASLEFAKKLNMKSLCNGVVQEVSDNKITIKENESGQLLSYDLPHNVPLNNDGRLNYTPLVKPGDEVSKGTYIAEHCDVANGQIRTTSQIRIVYSDNQYTTEDSCHFSEKLAREKWTAQMFRSVIETSKHKDTITRTRPITNNKYENGIIREGKVVKPGDTLAYLETIDKNGKVIETNEVKADKKFVFGIVDKITEPMAKTYEDTAYTEGFTSKIQNVNILYFTPLQLGNKTANSRGDKHTVSCFTPDREMPKYTGGRENVDGVMSATSIMTRYNIPGVNYADMNAQLETLGLYVSTKTKVTTSQDIQNMLKDEWNKEFQKEDCKLPPDYVIEQFAINGEKSSVKTASEINSLSKMGTMALNVLSMHNTQNLKNLIAGFAATKDYYYSKAEKNPEILSFNEEAMKEIRNDMAKKYESANLLFEPFGRRINIKKDVGFNNPEQNRARDR